MSSKNSALKRKKEIYVLAQNQAEKVMCSCEALERMKQNLLSAISLFLFSNQNLKFCVIIHISSKPSVAWFPGEGTLCQESRLIRSPWMLFRSEEFLGLSTCKCLQTQEFSPSLTDRNTPDRCRRKWPSLREQFTLQNVDLRKASEQLHWSLYFLVLNSMCSQFPLEIHSYLQNRKLLLQEKERKKINPFAYFDFVFVNFWTDGNIPQWKFYKNFHLLTECRPEIFPWWKSGVWVIKQALCYLPGIFTLQSEESESPSITVTTFFFPLHLGKWPIPSSQAQ